MPKGDKARQLKEKERKKQQQQQQQQNNNKQTKKHGDQLHYSKVSYKTGSCCIANGITRILPDIIYSDQTGFITGRCTLKDTRLL